MDWSEVGSFVKKAAPILGTAIGGPAGGAAGGAVSLLLSAFGVDSDKPSALMEAMKADPEVMVKLKKIELDNIAHLGQIALLSDRAYLNDRQDARSRDEKLKKAGYKNHRADLMILVAFLSFVFICWLVNSNAAIKPGVLAIFNMAIGALLKMIGDAFQFEFGSSRGSKEKDLLSS
ncbi:MAG: hypothetical protein DRP02_11800 [Candidatus Gerdarchaeota archaeon]|nr:MAG: hypothetical protein DRP02_11800 [Candidatus Gerdarchaeota archaeon]